MTSALLIRLGGLGDLLVALPALRLVRASFPDASLHLLARKEYGGLLREAGIVDRVFSADAAKWAPLFEAGGPACAGEGGPGRAPAPAYAGGRAKAHDPPPTEFRRELSGYDWIAGWFQGLRAAADFREFFRSGDVPSADPVPACAKGWAGTNAGAFPPSAILYDPASGLPISRFFFDRTRDALCAGLAAHSRGPAASFDDCRLLFPPARSRRERFSVVHPGSGGRAKSWPLDRFLKVILALRATGLDGFLVSGEAESGREADLAALPLPFGWRRLVRPPLSDLARMLHAAAVYVGNDSGPTHLAAACGAETVAVFRQEFRAAWAPFGRSTVLSAPRVEDVAAEDVIAAVMKVLDGTPAA